eukprot:3053116-Heterocapsa_arctica.AAC.1
MIVSSCVSMHMSCRGIRDMVVPLHVTMSFISFSLSFSGFPMSPAPPSSPYSLPLAEHLRVDILLAHFMSISNSS